MPKFLKLFRRKPKTDDPAAAGILSPQPTSTTAQTQPPKQKKQKKLSKRQAKKQKKKDKLAHFPSSSNGNGGVDGGTPSGTAPAAPGWEGAEEHKENIDSGPAAALSPSAARVAPSSAVGGGANKAVAAATSPSSSSRDQYADAVPTNFYNNDSIYDKPALSIIDEEKSPKNSNVTSPVSAVSGSGSEEGGSNAGVAPNLDGNKGGDPPQAQAQATPIHPPIHPPIMSPMSGNKPPLTPNRLGRASNGSGTGGAILSPGGAILSPSQFRSPNANAPGSGRHPPGKLNPNGMTIDTDAVDMRVSLSPDNESLRGTGIAGSEEMCLSADEDEEYNRLAGGCKRGESPNPGNSAAIGNSGGKDKLDKFVSVLDRSPFSYASEEAGDALFPALAEDGDPWRGRGARGGATDGHVLPMAHETQEDIRAWTPSPTKKGAFTFQGDTLTQSSGDGGGGRAAGGTSSTSRSTDGGGGAGSTGHRPRPAFDNFRDGFADFEPFDPSGSSPRRQYHNTNASRRQGGGGGGGSKSVAPGGSSPVSALLEDSRARRKQLGSSHRSMEGSPNQFLPRTVGGGGGSSINSAPVLTPSHIRSQVQRSKGGGGSISRVIDNLELHVNKNKRQGPSSAANSSSVNSLSQMSQHSRSEGGSGAGGATMREAKERIRRENLMSSEGRMIDMLAAGGPQAASAASAANHAHANAGGDGKDQWLFDEVADTLGPRSAAADLESIDGRSHRSSRSRSSLGGKSHRSSKSHRSHRSRKSRGAESSRGNGGGGGGGGGHRLRPSRHADDGLSVDSRASRNSRASYRSYQTTKSMVSQMSEQSRSVANDLLRLEAQLSMVGKSRGSLAGERAAGGGPAGGNPGATPPGGVPAGGSASVASKAELAKLRDDCGMTVTSRDFSRGSASHQRRHGHGRPSPSSQGRNHISASARRAAARTLRSRATVVAPPGKLGIILANRTDSRGTVVSGVRTSSVLAEQVSPGDRIVAIDDEDVSQMNVKEITTIMARKSEFERVLSLLAAPRVQYD